MRGVQVITILMVYMIEPFLWGKSMSVSFHKFKNEILYWALVLGYYFIAILKQGIMFQSFDNKRSILFSLVLLIYMFLSTIIFYQDRLYRKIMNCSIFCFLTCVSESVIIFSAIYIGGFATSDIMKFGTVNIVCTILSKLLLLGLIKIFFFQDGKKLIHSLYGSKEIVLLILLNVAADAYLTESLRRENFRYIRECAALFITVQFMFICNTMYITIVLRKKNKKMAAVENELDKLRQRSFFSEKLMRLRHDMKAHAMIISNLISQECYQEVKEYISNIFGDIQDVDKISAVTEPALSTLLSHYIVEMEKKEIRFCRHILMDNFYMSSKDLCAIISNMLDNAMEASEKLDKERRYVSLDIFPTEGGYRITCMNPYEKIGNHFETLKKDRRNHGHGLMIIKATAEKNHGGMEIIPNQKKWFEVTCFIPTPEL